MRYIFGFLHHLRVIKNWAALHAAQLQLDATNLQLTIRHGMRNVAFIPRFTRTLPDGRIAYSQAIAERGEFIGWLPYDIRRWPVATDKIIFKRFCQQSGLPVPRIWTTGQQAEGNVIVKSRSGSFGAGQRGPFLIEAGEPISYAEDEYLEEFIPGSSVKIWYWGKTPVVMEENQPPSLIGDGIRTLKELAQNRRFGTDATFNLEKSLQILAWQGYSPDMIAKPGEIVQLDYRHASIYDPIEIHDKNIINKVSEEEKQELINLGNVFSAVIPKEFGLEVIYTLDAVRERISGKKYFLEINCNPMVHPATYQSMLNSVFRIIGN